MVVNYWQGEIHITPFPSSDYIANVSRLTELENTTTSINAGVFQFFCKMDLKKEAVWISMCDNLLISYVSITKFLNSWTN
jgi:hypothetical protein